MTTTSLVAGFAIFGTVLCACSIAVLLLSDSYSAKLKSRLRELPAGNGRRSTGKRAGGAARGGP